MAKSVRPSVRVFVCPCVRLSVCLSVRVSVCPCVCLSSGRYRLAADAFASKTFIYKHAKLVKGENILEKGRVGIFKAKVTVCVQILQNS